MVQGPILSTPIRDLSLVLQNQEEVNQIAAMYYHNHNNHHGKSKQPSKHGKGKTSSASTSSSGKKASSSSSSSHRLYLAAADDAGTVRFMESTSNQSQIIHHDPNGIAIVPSCAFRPGGGSSLSSSSSAVSSSSPKKHHRNTLELVSGGTDCKIHLWDVFKPKYVSFSFLHGSPGTRTLLPTDYLARAFSLSLSLSLSRCMMFLLYIDVPSPRLRYILAIRAVKIAIANLRYAILPWYIPWRGVLVETYWQRV